MFMSKYYATTLGAAGSTRRHTAGTGDGDCCAAFLNGWSWNACCFAQSVSSGYFKGFNSRHAVENLFGRIKLIPPYEEVPFTCRPCPSVPACPVPATAAVAKKAASP